MLKTTVKKTAVMSTAVMSSKGQVVIPLTLRKRFNMKEGTTIVFQEEHGQIVLKPRNFAAILALAGTLDYPLEETLMEERALEAKRDEERAQEYENGEMDEER